MFENIAMTTIYVSLNAAIILLAMFTWQVFRIESEEESPRLWPTRSEPFDRSDREESVKDRRALSLLGLHGTLAVRIGMPHRPTEDTLQFLGKDGDRRSGC